MSSFSFDLAEKLYARESDPQIKNDLEELMTCIGDAVIAETHGSHYDGAHGLSIYLPGENAYAGYSYNFEPQYADPGYGLDFCGQTSWVEFLSFSYDVN